MNPFVFPTVSGGKKWSYIYSIWHLSPEITISVCSCHHSNLSHRHCSADSLQQPANCSSYFQACSFLICFITLKSEWTFYGANVIISPPCFDSILFLICKILHHLALIHFSSHLPTFSQLLTGLQPYSDLFLLTPKAGISGYPYRL